MLDRNRGVKSSVAIAILLFEATTTEVHRVGHPLGCASTDLKLIGVRATIE